MAVTTKSIRNIVLLGHTGEGKTTLMENLLYKGGAIPKKGSIADGTTVSDYSEDEKERKNSIGLSMASYEKDGVKVNIIDSPGYLDYIGEVIGGVNAADSQIMLIDAFGGVKVGTSKFWKIAKNRGLPGIIVVNKMDNENANFAKVLDNIKKTLGKNCVALYYPNGAGSSFSGVANILTGAGIDGLQGDDKAKAEALSNEMVEGVAESDDALLEKYFDAGTLTSDELKPAFRKAVIEGKIIPVIPAAIEKGIGVDEIMAAIANYLPSPEDAAPAETEEEGKTVEAKADGSFSAQVFKTISDPFAGQISILRIKSGQTSSNQSVKNVTKDAVEKLGQLFFLKGKDHINTDSVVAGDIVAVAKLKDTDTGDTLCNDKTLGKFKRINFPEPAVSYSIKPRSRSDEDKISDVLTKLMAEDPSFSMLRDKQTHELVVSGMGELHLKTMINRMKGRYNVEVDIGTPKVAYKETITGQGDSKYRHKKQSGGAGQFAEVWMRIEPLPRGTGFEFVDEVVGGAIPKQFLGSCEKGVLSAMGEGVVAGFPVTDVRATVYDGKTHPVDSKDIAFQIAAAHAFRESCEKAKPTLLEPVMNIELTVPEENMGDVTGSLSTHRGRVQGMDSEGGMQIVKAQMPLAEMYTYANELKSITGGRATYTMTFSHYDPVPSNVAQKIAAESKRAKEEKAKA
ncbi:elongation factor G [Candidatus Omnitrophota bacterium]